MKKVLSLIIAMFILLPLIVSCETDPDTPEYITVGTALTVTVSPSGDDSTADGTAEKPFATIEAATRSAFLLGADQYSTIDILIKEGEYTLNSTITIEKIEGYAPIRFIGEGNVTVSGSSVADLFTVYGDSVTLENLKLNGSLGNGISVSADNFSLLNCEIANVAGEYALKAVGNNLTISGNHIHDCSGSAILVSSGDMETLTKSNTKIYNNHIHDYGTAEDTTTVAIGASGVDITVSHNEIANSTSGAIVFNGAYIVVEYNKINDIAKNGGEIGAVSTSGIVQVGNVIRYNHIKNVGDLSDPTADGVGSSAIKCESFASYYEIYGNIIETVAGNGIRMDSRGATIRNNLIIDCSNWYLWSITLNYAKYFKQGEIDGKIEVPDYIYSPVWKEANPDLKTVVTDLTQTTSRDPYAWAAPANTVIQDNWIYFNKAIRVFNIWGAAPYSIEDTVYTFCEDTIDIEYGSKANDNMSIYNSRRDEVVIEEVLTTAGGLVDMDTERFATIGRVMDEWKLG